MSAAPEPRRVVIDGERAVVWTDADGCVRAARDQCPHRRAPLSAGTVLDGVLQCAYHGWSYDGRGRCTVLPALGPDGRIPERAQLDMLPVPVDLDLYAADAFDAYSPVTNDWVDGHTPGWDHFWHPVARIGEVDAAPDGMVGVGLAARSWQVSRDAAGAWTARSADGSTAWGVCEHLDHVWLAPLEPLAPLPVAEEWAEESGGQGWHHRRLNRAEGRLGVGLLLDNQLDAGHFPFVHAATFGSPAAAAVPPAELVRQGTTVSATMRIPISATNDPLALAGARPLQQHRTMHYEYHAPLWLRLRLDYEDMGGATVLLFAFVPLGAGRARMDIDVLFRHPDGFTDEQLVDRVAFEERVIGEDLRLQRLFEDLRLPLDPTVELHTKADRLSVQCRHVLRELLAEARRIDRPASA